MVVTDGVPELRRLEAWRSALAKEAEALRSEIRVKQADLARVEERLSLIGRLIEVDADADPTPDRPRQSAEGAGIADAIPRAIVSELEDAVEIVLRDKGAPMHISDIRSQLLARGVQIPGRGDEANIIVRLRRFNSRFTRTARGTYGLAEWGIREMTSKRRVRRRAPR